MRPCKFCSGEKVIQSPAGILQRCPICDGTGQEPPVEEAFEYGLDVTIAGDAANSINSVSIVDSDFRMVELIATSTGAFTCLLADGGSKKQLSNQAMHQLNLFGTAQLPFRLESPYTFKRNSSIQITLSDLSHGQNVIRLAFKGVQLL